MDTSRTDELESFKEKRDFFQRKMKQGHGCLTPGNLQYV